MWPWLLWRPKRHLQSMPGCTWQHTAGVLVTHTAPVPHRWLASQGTYGISNPFEKFAEVKPKTSGCPSSWSTTSASHGSNSYTCVVTSRGRDDGHALTDSWFVSASVTVLATRVALSTPFLPRSRSAN